MPTVLFLCTGNYYRSRFAEHVFNALALSQDSPWRATSRGLALERGRGNVGAMSPLVTAALSGLSIAPSDPQRMPQSLGASDLEQADHVVAIKEAEHRPLLEVRFAEWSGRRLDRVEFWDVDDVEFLAAHVALNRIRDNVGDLCKRLTQARQR